jgi:hypothetical protein
MYNTCLNLHRTKNNKRSQRPYLPFEKEGKKSNYHINYLNKKERLVHDTEGYGRTTIYESTANEMFFSDNEMLIIVKFSKETAVS